MGFRARGQQPTARTCYPSRPSARSRALPAKAWIPTQLTIQGDMVWGVGFKTQGHVDMES